MVRANRICGVIALAIAAIVVIGARKLVFFAAGTPGPGLVPILATVLIAVCGLGLLIGKATRETTIVWPGTEQRGKLIGSAASIFVYSGLVPLTGTFAASALFLAALSWWWGGYRWWVAALFGVIASGVTVLLFDVLLGVPLPRGGWD